MSPDEVLIEIVGVLPLRGEPLALGELIGRGVDRFVTRFVPGTQVTISSVVPLLLLLLHVLAIGAAVGAETLLGMFFTPVVVIIASKLPAVELFKVDLPLPVALLQDPTSVGLPMRVDVVVVTSSTPTLPVVV